MKTKGGATTDIWDYEEKIIGLFNNKQLYQKTFEVTTGNKIGWVQIADITNLNIERIVSIDGTFRTPTGGWELQIDYTVSTTGCMFGIRNKKSLESYNLTTSYISSKATVRIKYTKTTD